MQTGGFCGVKLFLTEALEKLEQAFPNDTGSMQDEQAQFVLVKLWVGPLRSLLGNLQFPSEAIVGCLAAAAF